MPRMAYFSTKEIGIILMEFLLQFLILGFIQETPLAHTLKNSAQAPPLVAPLNTVKILKLEHDFITVQTENFPMDYPRDYTYIWEVRAPPGRRITIRKNIFDLRAGDRLIVSESLWNKTFELGNFSAAAPEFKKITSLGNVVRLELALGENTSALMVSSSGFVLTCEITGYCSHSDSSRMSCGDQDPNVCFSLGSLSTPAHSHASAHSTAPSTRYGDRCDGVWDCPRGGFDEQNCEFCPRGYLPCASDAASFYNTETTAPTVTAATTTTTTTSTVVPPLIARLGRKQSRTAGRTGGTGARGTLCYPASARCDGHYNCPDHSDELGCSAEVCSLASQRFLCDPLGPRGQCIPLDSVCNTIPDCYNGADELEELCLRNTEAAAGFSPEVARLIAQRVARQALETSLAIATTQLDSDLRRVLIYSLSALIAPLLSTLAFGFICRSHAIRARRRLRRAPRFNSPILRLLRDELRRRPPPPTYSEALDNSLFEEPILECAAAAAAPPSIPLSATGLTQAQVESVRQRSMKPSNRVDVACFCDLSASASTVSQSRADRGDDVEEQRELARDDEEEEDGDEEEDEGDTDASSEGEEDEDETEAVSRRTLPEHPVPSARGDPGPSDPAPPPLGAQAARETTTLPPASSGRGGGGLWQWMSRLRLLGGPYQPMRAGGAVSPPAAVATAETSGSGGAAATVPDSGGDLSRRHSDNSDEVDTAGPSRTPSASPGDSAIPASAFAHSPEQTTVPLLCQASQRAIADPDCPPEVPSSPC